MITYDVLEAPYENLITRKQIQILKRSKKKRIKNKAFTKILLLAPNEFPVLSYKGLALLKYEYYMDLVNRMKYLEEQLELYKENLTHD